jgi:drug/metabolite transporter (DMT)-like permease
MWIRYAIDWDRDVLFRLSEFGASMAVVYIGLFLLLSERHDPRRINLLLFAIGGAILLVSAVGLDYMMGKSTSYNVICCATSCFASAAPAYNLVS